MGSGTIGLSQGSRAVAFIAGSDSWHLRNQPSVRKLITMIHDAGGKIYACRASVDMFHLKREDFCAEVDDVISVGQFYEKAAGGQIIFT